jgi:large subunit ribosomal protein L11
MSGKLKELDFMVEKKFHFIISGGEATGGPPIGPAIGPLGVNIMAIVNKINDETSEYMGVKVPVEVTIDTDSKEFSLRVGMLSAYALITQSLGIDKGSDIPNSNFVGDVSFNQVIDIAKKKWNGLLAGTLRSAVREIVGSCQSIGVTIDGKSAKEVQGLIESGEYNDVLQKAE